MFEIYTSRAPYAEQTDASARRNFQEGAFPLDMIQCPLIRRVIEKCWMDEYIEVSDVGLDLLAVRGAVIPSERDNLVHASADDMVLFENSSCYQIMHWRLGN
jgi:hypothetical protein